MRNLAFTISLAALLGGCAIDGGSQANSSVSTAAMRGMEVAQLRCSACHSIGDLEVSPRANAPTFRQLRLRFNDITWERVMAEIAAGGHDEMPPVALDTTDVRDVRNYIEALR